MTTNNNIKIGPLVCASKHWMAIQTTDKPFNGPVSLLHPAVVYSMFQQRFLSTTRTSQLELHIPAHTTKLLFLGSPQEAKSVASKLSP